MIPRSEDSEPDDAGLSLLRSRWLRRAATGITILGFAFAATWYSACEIQEKWRIRGDWADTHAERMTADGWDALSADGANLLLGPLIFGFQALLLFVAVSLVLAALRIIVIRIRSYRLPPDDSNNDEGTQAPSENPYHPPQAG